MTEHRAWAYLVNNTSWGSLLLIESEGECVIDVLYQEKCLSNTAKLKLKSSGIIMIFKHDVNQKKLKSRGIIMK